jgi:iron complex outermembrane receptor protein
MRTLLLFVFTFIFSIQAQNSDSLKSYNLKEITVQSSLVLQPKSIIKISEKTIVLSDAVTLDKIAPLLPSTKVQTNSRGETLFYLRNSGKRRLSLMMDGVPLNIPWDNRIDLSLIPTTAISKILITKGIPSVIYGPNSLGGVINISTLEIPEKSSRGELKASAGENGFKSFSSFYGSSNGDFSYLISAGYSGRDSYPLPSKFSDPANPGSSRLNSYYNGYNFFGKIKKKYAGNSEVGFSVSYLNKEKGVPPEIGVSKIRYWQYPKLSDLSMTINGVHRFLSSNSFLTYAVNLTKYHSTINQFTNSSYNVLDKTEKGDDYTYFGRVIYTMLYGSSSILKLSGSGYSSTHYEDILSGTPVTEEKNVYSQNVFSAGAEYEYTHKKLTVNFGASLDGAATPQTGDKPKKSPTYDFGVNSGLVYTFSRNFSGRFNAGRKTRFPTMREMYSGALGKFELNPDLQAEVAHSGEAGMIYSFNNGDIESDLFLTYITNGIVRTKLPNGKYKRINKSAIRNYGIETELEYNFTEALKLRLNASFINSFAKNSNGEFRDTVEYAPQIIAGGSFTYTLNRTSLLIGANYIGNEYEAESPYFVKVPDYLLINFRAGYLLSIFNTKTTIYFRADNLTDKLYYTQFGLPEPGRELRVGFKMNY